MSTAAVVDDDDRGIDLDAIAAEAMAKAKTTDGARKLIFARAQNSPALMAALAWEHTGSLVSRFYTIGRRRALSFARNPDRALADDSLATVDGIILHGLLAWALPGPKTFRKALGEATREEVAESLRYCRTMSGTYDLNARFLGNVHKLATDEKKPIRRQLTPEQVKSCHERAEKASA